MARCGWPQSLSGRARRGDAADELDSHLAAPHRRQPPRRHDAGRRARRRRCLKLGGFAQTTESIRDRSAASRSSTRCARTSSTRVRVLRRNRGFTATAVAHVRARHRRQQRAIFSIVNAIPLRPLPLAEPSQLVHDLRDRSAAVAAVRCVFRIRRSSTGRSRIEASNRWRRSPIEIFRSAPATKSLSREGKSSAPNLFDVVGVQPAIGRAFREWLAAAVGGRRHLERRLLETPFRR